MFTEFGADAFNVINKVKIKKSQAYYMLGNWKFEMLPGLGKAGNYRGFTLFSDGWWKYGQTKT
jgi:hypothetical protein